MRISPVLSMKQTPIPMSYGEQPIVWLKDFSTSYSILHRLIYQAYRSYRLALAENTLPARRPCQTRPNDDMSIRMCCRRHFRLLSD